MPHRNIENATRLTETLIFGLFWTGHEAKILAPCLQEKPHLYVVTDNSLRDASPAYLFSASSPPPHLSTKYFLSSVGFCFPSLPGREFITLLKLPIRKMNLFRPLSHFKNHRWSNFLKVAPTQTGLSRILAGQSKMEMRKKLNGSAIYWKTIISAVLFATGS